MTFGSPVVAQAPEPINPRWVTQGAHGRLVCEGAERRPVVHCPQCPDAPDELTIQHAFGLAEPRVLQCEPPADVTGHLTLRARISGAGLPLEIEFLGVAIDESVATCMAAALCNVRTPNFRSTQTIVDHAFVVMTPGGE